MESFGYFLLSTLIAVLITNIYFVWAGRELQRETGKLRVEAEKLRKLHELTLFALAYPEAKPEPKYDDNGNVVGLTIQLSARSTSLSSGGATMTVKPPPKT